MKLAGKNFTDEKKFTDLTNYKIEYLEKAKSYIDKEINF